MSEDIDQIYAQFNAFNTPDVAGRESTYGEIPTSEARWLFNFVQRKVVDKPARGFKKFYDLGSGKGQLVLLAKDMGFLGIQQAEGIEYLEDRHDIAMQAKDMLPPPRRSGVNFTNQDIRDADISDGNVFLCTATCFDRGLLDVVKGKIDQSERGSVAIIVDPMDPQFMGEGYEILADTEIEFSGVPSPVYVFQKK